MQDRRAPQLGSRVPSSTSSRYAYASRDVRDVRDVPCVRRRARDRSIGRGRSEDPEIRLRLRQFRRIFLLFLPVLTCLASRGHSHELSQAFCTRLMESREFLVDMERT